MKIFRLVIILLIGIMTISCSHEDYIESIINELNKETINEAEKADSTTKENNPTSEAVLNAYKRAHQMLDICWVPIASMPNVSSTDGYQKDKTYIGLPYSSTKEIDKYIGFDVSFKTFMTALNNPYSVLYSEDISTRNKSSHGFTYHGAECGPYMGIHCTNFVAYSLGFPLPWITAQYKYLNKIGVLINIEDQSFDGVQLMDIIWKSGHVILVTNIYKDSNNNITKITVSESIKNLPRSQDYTKESFNNMLQNNKAIIYRYKNLNAEAIYEKSPFVAVYNETKENYKYNNDICTYRGDYATFREGELIILNYNLKSIKSWSEIELYKNDSLFATLFVNKESHELDLSSLNLKYGLYKARMKDGNNYSDYTYFEVLQTKVEYESGSSEQIIKFSSENSKPLYFLYCYENGWNMGTHIFTELEKSRGYVLIDSNKMLQEQHEFSDRRFAKKTFLKVFFQGKYGRITNIPILTDLY